MTQTTIGKIIGKTAISILKCAALVIVSSTVSTALRENTKDASETIVQGARFVRNRFQNRQAA